MPNKLRKLPINNESFWERLRDFRPNMKETQRALAHLAKYNVRCDSAQIKEYIHFK